MSSVFKALKDGFFFTIEFDKHLFLDAFFLVLSFPTYAFDQIVCISNQLRFLGANQIVAPLMKGISHFTWKGKKLAVVLVDKIGCYHASPFGLRLNDHCGVRQTRNDTVANKKVFAVKLFLSGKFRKNPPPPARFCRKKRCVLEDKFDPDHVPCKQWWSNRILTLDRGQ